MITEIRNGTVIAWIDDSHQIVEQGKVVFDDQTIIYVGQTYEGKSDQVIDATGRLVIPGLINFATSSSAPEAIEPATLVFSKDSFISEFIKY